MRNALICLIDGYRYVLSPMLGTNCRFYPSCSCYAREALQMHGTLKGLMLTAKRVIRCHPWSSGGYDPVLPTASNVSSFPAMKDFHG